MLIGLHNRAEVLLYLHQLAFCGIAKGDQIDAGGSSSGDDPGETVGEGDTGSGRGAAHVPYGEVLAEYEARATRALDRADVPPSLRALVRAYFDRLAGRTPT